MLPRFPVVPDESGSLRKTRSVPAFGLFRKNRKIMCRRLRFFLNFGNHGRTLFPHTLLQARLRLLRLLQKRRPAAHGRPAGGHAPRTGRPARLSGRRSGDDPLFRRRNAVALHARSDQGTAGPRRTTLRLLRRRRDDARSQSRRPDGPSTSAGCSKRASTAFRSAYSRSTRRLPEADEPPPHGRAGGRSDPRCAARRIRQHHRRSDLRRAGVSAAIRCAARSMRPFRSAYSIFRHTI